MGKTVSVSNYINVKNGVVPVSPRAIEFNTLLISTDDKIKSAIPATAEHIELTGLNQAKALYEGHDLVIDFAREYFNGVKYATKTPEKLIIKYFDSGSAAGSLDALLTSCDENIQGWNILCFDGVTDEQRIEAANWQKTKDDDSILSVVVAPLSVLDKDAADPFEALNDTSNLLKLATDNRLLQVAVSSYFGCLDFDRTGGRVSLAYRQFPNIATEDIDDAMQFRGVELGYNFYPSISANNYTQKSFQEGNITGERKWADSWAGGSWVKASFEQNLLQTLGLNVAFPANIAGQAKINATMVPIMEQFKSWGGASANMEIDDSQQREILQNITEGQYNTLQDQGYIIAFQSISPLTRTNRDFIDVYVYWLDAGVIQKIKVYSYEVQ